MMTSRSEARIFYLRGDGRESAARFCREGPEGWRIKAEPPKRSLEQNDAQWPILDAFSEQLEWPVNGKMCKLTPEEWKDILTAAFMREHVRIAQGLDGGIVMLGMRTSTMSKAQFSEWLEFLISTAAARGLDTSALCISSGVRVQSGARQ